MSSVALSLAIFASILSMLHLGWAIFSWTKDRGPRVTVSIDLASIRTWDGSPGLSVIQVTARNKGNLPVTVTGAGLVPLDKPDGPLYITIGKLRTLPGQIPAKGLASTYLEMDRAPGEGVDVTKPLRGFVDLATGETVRSNPKIIRNSESSDNP